MTEIITSRDARFALELVKKICAEAGPGLPGSSQERERALIIKRELESLLGAANVAVEEFTLAPGTFVSVYPVSALCTLAAALLNSSMGRLPGISPLGAAAALALTTFSLLLVVFEFTLGFEFVDPLFKKKQSVNVIGALRRPETKDVQRLLLLSGHHDSAWENTWLGLLGDLSRLPMLNSRRGSARGNPWPQALGYVFLFTSITWLLGLLFMLAASILQLAGALSGSAAVLRAGTPGWFTLAFPIAPSILFGLFFNRGRRRGGTVPGAADNLSASALAVALCRFLVNNPAYIPADTEIRFVSFGSEEAGLRGSRRYVERHLGELKRLDARLLNFETVAHPEITILTSDVNGTVKNSPEMVKSAALAAERAGVPYREKAAFFGTLSDAGPFSRAGLKAATLLPFQMPQQMVAFYHQKWDQPEILAEESLNNVLKLALEWVRSGGEPC